MIRIFWVRIALNASTMSLLKRFTDCYSWVSGQEVVSYQVYFIPINVKNCHAIRKCKVCMIVCKITQRWEVKETVLVRQSQIYHVRKMEKNILLIFVMYLFVCVSSALRIWINKNNRSVSWTFSQLYLINMVDIDCKRFLKGCQKIL